MLNYIFFQNFLNGFFSFFTALKDGAILIKIKFVKVELKTKMKWL